ncbi:Mu-like prophage major head subunit gpT family protein [Blastopirellula marina]|uniref:Bacteriophage Mu GpT domain-containing protein n=1 Tax=Blastopirellula marina TaxID=124 RepID=A0A2S8GIN6_9BACT|nr:Mu-like prophage major head subunit gpT family protein [Blastopirellula marina]PQO44210.1 hypothetical protein C5Y93_19755 [Blastopirellula marina]
MATSNANTLTKSRDLTITFDEAFRLATPIYPMISHMVESDGADEKIGWLGSMPGVREWLGDRQFNTLRAADFTLVNKLWESSVMINRQDFNDDRKNVYNPVLQELAKTAALHPDQLMLDLLPAGENTLCWDGQNYFDTDHVWGDSGSQSNDLTYDASNTAAITESEFKAAFRQAVNAILTFKRDNGEYFYQGALEKLSDLTLLVPVALRGVAHDTLESTLIGGGDSNVIIDRPKIITSNRLTNNTKFYTLFTGARYFRPFVFQARQPLVRELRGLDSIKTKELEFMTEARYNVGYLAWWNCVLTTFT